MKKKFTFLIAALLLLTMISQPTRLWGQEKGESNYTITFKKNSGDGSSVSTNTACSTIVSNGASYLSGNVATATNVYYNGGSGLKLGTSSGAGVIKMNLSTTGQAYAKTIVVSAKRYNSSKSVSLSVNGGSSQSITNYDDFSNYSFTLNSDITYIQLNSTKYCWIESITVNYTTCSVTYDCNNGTSGCPDPSTLTVKKSANITLAAAPSRTNYTFNGWKTGETTYAAGAAYTVTADVTFTAQWTATGPTVTIDQAEYDFGEVTVGTTPSPTHTFSVTPANLTADLTITVPSGYSVSPSSISQSTTTATNVTVTFTPTAVQAYNGNLSISGGGLGSEVTASLSGTGGCITPSALTYTSPVNLTLENGEAEYQLTPTGGGNGGSISYAVTTNPGGNGDIIGDDEDTFYAIETGQYVVTATQAANGNYCECVATITINVTGTDPVCEITPSTGHNFGTILTNTSESFDFSVAIANLEHGLTLSVPSGYEVFPSSIAANASSPVNVTVTFTPTAATAYNGSLTISGDDFDNDITAALSGTGDAGRTVTFEPYSGSCDPTSIRVLTGGSIATLPTATADGATFYGWATSKVASTPTAPTSSIVSAPYTPTGNVTLHAVYKIAKEFDNTTACAGSYTIYSVVETNDKSTTNYYATGTLNKKYSSTTTASDAKSFTLEKVQGYGNDEWAIKDGNNYVAWSSSTDLTTQSGDYKWIITQGVKGTWRVTAASTLNSTVRGFVFQASTTNKFGGYALSNITPGAAYYDIEFGSASFTYNSETPVAKPTFNIAGGSYAGEQSVTINCTTPGATIYYTTNGSDPTASSTQYNNDAITVDETMTIKAIAIKSGMANSTVAYATYSIVPLLTTMDEIFEAATTNGETAGDVAVSFNNWVVSGISGNENQIVYVTDNDGKGFIIYKYTNGFALNDKLSGTVAGTPLKLSYGSSQFTGLTASAEGLTVTHDGTITPVVKTISQLTSGVNTGAVVTISDLTYNGTNLVDGSSNTISPNSSLYTYGSALTSGHDYSSVTGVFVMSNTTKQIHPRSAADIVEVEYSITLNDVPSGCTIGTDGDIATAKYGQTVTLTQSAGAGYRFISWSVNSGAVTVTDNQFTMPKGAVTVSATFAPTYAIATSVTPENTGTVTAEPNPAIEGETVTLTIEPETGYALKSISAYKTGESSTPVTITENTITMPAYGVTVAAEFATEYSVTYYVNGGTGDAVVVKYGAGATVNAADVPGAWTAPEGKLFKNWKTVASGEGTEYEVGAQITDNIADNYDLYAQWRDIVYHVSFSVNGVIVSERNVNYNTAIGTLPEDPELAPLTFLGWSSTSATGATNVTASWKPTGENEDVTVYAVFGSMSTDNLTLTGTTTNIPTGYSSYTWKINDEDYFQTYNVMQGQYSTNRFIQYKSAGGYLYNIKDFGKIKSIVVTYYTGGNSNSSREIAIRINDEKFSGASGGTVMSVDYSGDVYTFTYDDEHYDYHYFSIYNSSNTSTIASIRINYEAAAPLTVNVIDENTNMTTDIEATTCVVVENGATLNFTGENKGNANNLIIEDGGQLVLPNNATVAATVQKTTEASTAKSTNNWYAIASPVADLTIASFVPTAPEKWNVFRYIESTNYWNEYRDESTTNGCAPFTTFENGRGYLYRSTTANLAFAGDVNAGDENGEVNYDLSFAYAGSKTEFKGINLLGNPFTHNITWSNLETTNVKTAGYYLLIEEGENQGKWSATASTTATIAPMQAFLVQANDTGAKVTIKNSAAKGGEEKSYNDNIMFTVMNGQQSDETYVFFKEGHGLNKIDHRNAEIPMLYVVNNGERFAIAEMPDNTKSINLGFNAKTFGKYTLSLKANGNFSYLHLVDRLTGEDVDMLLDGEYSFIASPTDNANRFIVRLEYSENAENSDIFAYQNGSDIIVSGEGELQIFDVMGRMIATRRINGVETINVPTNGVYIFRLNEKAQKIVVE